MDFCDGFLEYILDARWQLKKFMGREYEGTLRTSFWLILPVKLLKSIIMWSQ